MHAARNMRVKTIQAHMVAAGYAALRGEGGYLKIRNYLYNNHLLRAKAAPSPVADTAVTADKNPRKRKELHLSFPR